MTDFFLKLTLTCPSYSAPIVGNRDASSGADNHEGPLLCPFTDPQSLLVSPSSTTYREPSLLGKVSDRLRGDSFQAPEASEMRRKEKSSLKACIYAGKACKMAKVT